MYNSEQSAIPAKQFRILSHLKDHRLIWISFLLSFLVFYFFRFFDQYVYQIFLAERYLAFHTVVEFASIIMYVSSFLLIYYVGDHDNRLYMKILGSTLLFVALIDFWHTFYYEGMAGLVTDSSVQAATSFWIIGRLGFAGGLLLSAFIGRSRRVSLKYRYAIALIPAVLAVVFLFYISLFPQYFPTLFQENTGLTPVKHYLEYFIIALMILAFLLIYRDYQKTRRKTQVLLLSAIIVSVFSELAFTSYASVYDIYNLIGHVYKLIASYLFFRVVFIYNILQPYNKLDRAKEEIRHYATNLEEIVQQRTLDVKVANDSLMKDIEYARNIQTAIMPSKASSFDSVRFYSEYVPFEKIGGDFFGIEDLNEDYIGFHIGDVAGHGIPAAMMTIFMKQSIISKKLYQNGKMDVYSPNEVLTNLYHRYNQTDFPSEMYAVILYGLFHKKTKEIVFSSSGLNTFPLLLRKEGTIEPIEHRGFPICKFIEDFDPQYENYAIAPKSGDRLFFYTDGLIDVTNFKGESFGETRLINLIKSHRMEPSDTLTSTILDTLDRFSKGRSRRDDIHFFFMDIQ